MRVSSDWIWLDGKRGSSIIIWIVLLHRSLLISSVEQGYISFFLLLLIFIRGWGLRWYIWHLLLIKFINIIGRRYCINFRFFSVFSLLFICYYLRVLPSKFMNLLLLSRTDHISKHGLILSVFLLVVSYFILTGLGKFLACLSILSRYL